MLRPSRRSRSLTRCVLSAAALWLGSVATPAPSAQVLPQPLGPEVLLRLPERQAEIRRQKFLDPETNAIVQRNEITEPTGGTRLLTDEEVRQLVLEDARRYRDRVGAIQPRFYDIVTHAAASAPEVPLPVVAVARFDPRRIPEDRKSVV